MLGTAQTSRNQSIMNMGFPLHKAFLEYQRKNKWTRDPCWVVKARYRMCFQTKHIWRCIYLTINDWSLAVLRRRSRAPNTPMSQQCSSVSPQETCCGTHGLFKKSSTSKEEKKQEKSTHTHIHTHMLPLLFLCHITFSPLSQTTVEQMLVYRCNQYFLVS